MLRGKRLWTKKDAVTFQGGASKKSPLIRMKLNRYIIQSVETRITHVEEFCMTEETSSSGCRESFSKAEELAV